MEIDELKEELSDLACQLFYYSNRGYPELEYLSSDFYKLLERLEEEGITDG